MTITLSELLFEKYMEYQRVCGERKTLKQFAEHIGIGQVYLNQIMNERRSAGEKKIALLANFFQDMRFYDAVKLPRPEALLSYTSRNWGSVPDEVKKRIAEDVSKYTSEPVPEQEDERTNTAKPG